MAPRTHIARSKGSEKTTGRPRVTRGARPPANDFFPALEPSIESVLLVDDEESVRVATQACLEALGVREVRMAGNGQDGLEILAEWTPSVLLLDLLMPGTDGFAVLKALRDLPPDARPDLVVVMSAIDDASLANGLPALGADAVLPKPFHLDELRAVLSRGSRQPADAAAR